MITQKELKELLVYDPSNGVFTYRARTAAWTNVGDAAGCLRPDGYMMIGLRGKYYLSH